MSSIPSCIQIPFDRERWVKDASVFASTGATMTFARLTWGVKESFRGYVEASGGTITVSDGANRTANGEFAFAALPGGDLTIPADGPPSGSARFQGTVEFDAHGGMLKATISEIGVDVEDGSLVLTALQAPGTARCTLAKLGPKQVTDQGAVILGTAITFDGMLQIGDHYPPGTLLDPVYLD